MDKCPKCGEYSLDYNVSKGRVECTYTTCRWHKKMSEKRYYQTLANRALYVCVPKSWKLKED